MKLKLSMVIALLCLAGVVTKSLAQCKEMKWPADKAKAEEQVAIYGDALKQGNPRGATAGILYMYSVAPQWNTKLYIDAADAYDKLADKETDPAKKKILADSLLIWYDLRIKNCGDEVNVLNRKAYASYKYNIKNKEKLKELLALYDKLFGIGGEKISDGNLVAYMTTVKANHLAFKDIPDDQVLSRYDKIMDIADKKIATATAAGKTADVQKLKEIKDAVDGLLISIVKVDCDFVKKNLAPKFKANPADLPLAKKIFSFMLNGKCTEDPLWLEAGEAIHKNSTEKDFGLVKALALTYLSKGNYERAEELLKEALALAPTPKDKGEIQLYMGSVEAKKGNYSGARDLFRQNGTAEGWEKIGDLYYNSFDNCAKKQNLAQDRLVYIAAYEMYQKAGNQQLMARAKAQFPSKEEIFLLNWQKGSTQQVGCWINESVVLNTRD
ncbi:MAG TPA: tetratricopeptide repeat protein [Cyclobacteriaceae bacterium]|nr:tetratricopeptide repeat protein [Cyclobacteriaceae bacterium]